MNNIFYILIMAATIYLIRVLPITLIRKPIKSRFLKSFLYYLPYVSLAVMTFPAIIEATGNPVAGVLAFIIGVLIAYFGANLFVTAVVCCAVIFIAETVLKLF